MHSLHAPLHIVRDRLGIGATPLFSRVLGPGSRVGEFCTVNTGSSIDHDCIIHEFSCIAPGVSTGGLVQIGECPAIGVGASISDRISIGRHTVVGTGAVVVRDTPDLVVAYGDPARVQRSHCEGEAYVRGGTGSAGRLGIGSSFDCWTGSVVQSSSGRTAPRIFPCHLTFAKRASWTSKTRASSIINISSD
jgi:hypothetical protein